MAFDFLQTALKQRAVDSLLRKRVEISSNSQAIIEVDGKHYINFSSNDYLGLSQHPDILQSFAEGLSLYGASSSASSIVTGYSREHRLLEDDICEHTKQESALLFSSGFAANQAVCQALFAATPAAIHSSSSANGQTEPKQKSTSCKRNIIADKYMHASFVDSAMQLSTTSPNVAANSQNSLSGTSQTVPQTLFSRFKHNDMQHLQSKLVHAGDTLVVTEGVFSMDGDKGSIASIQEVMSHASPNAWLMVDDAHAIGCVGENGMGSSVGEMHQGRTIDVLMGTFGKAIGTQGAFIAGSEALIEYLVNFAKHYIYSTAIPAAQARATRTSMQIMRKGIERQSLLENIDTFKILARAAGLPILNVDGPIQPLIIGDPVKANKLSQELKNLGVWVNAIRSPTVPKHSDRLRITLSSLHQKQDIQALVDALSMSIQR